MDMTKWDHGKEVFDTLSNNPYFQWDNRDLFSITSSQEVINKLVALDPTKMVAVSYVSLLLNTAFIRASVTLSSAILDDSFISFAANLRANKDELDEYSTPLMENFIERVQIACEDMTGVRFTRREHAGKDLDHSERYKLIDKDQMVKLLRDAVIATETPTHWIYSDGTMAKNQLKSISLQSDILLYSTLNDLVKDIREHALAYGFRYVTVNAPDPKSSSQNFIVYTSPSHAFFSADIHWDKHASQMRQDGARYQYHLDGLDYCQTHYPKLDGKNGLTITQDGKQVVGSLNSLEDKEKVWLLMLTELMALKLPSIIPGNNLITTQLLLTDDSQSNTNLPVVLEKPFEIEHISLEEAIKKTGIHNSLFIDTYLEILEHITIERLLPLDNTVLRLDDMAFIEEIPIKDTYSHESRQNYMCLRVYPLNHFGDKASTTKAHNSVIMSNLISILNKKFNRLWDNDKKAQDQWFEKMLKKKSDEIEEKWESFQGVRESQPNWNIYDDGVFNGRTTSERKLAIKQPADWNLLGVSHMPTLCSINEYRELIGYYTDKEDFERFILVPNSTKEIMEIFSCRKATLPKMLQKWERINNHDSLSYPWNNNALRFAAVWIYY
ncbi:hypothetical protein LMH73_014685 [Vibrio splendidus]|nr:hypothetical protein [Vibrio splendidus]MCC4882920.1 hypothetical protein [Vibrio splendidus]